ncbi:MAG: peptidoglycan endopeptidase [Candidatus Nanopelagicaceae bacterium]|nr:peptidoglycan endopeptidase [Candidatus Nanopelagicaceae bacterium]
MILRYRQDRWRVALFCISASLIATLAPTASAAPSADLRAVRAEVERLQEDAAEAGENAQAAKIQLGKLKKQLESVQQQADVQKQSVQSIEKSLAAIAVARYKSTGLGEGLELLFSADPSLYLSAAGSLENVTRKQAIELRKYATAKQRLDAASLTVGDKLRLVQQAEARYRAQASQVEAKLAQAEKLLAKLEKADRERILKLQAMDEEERRKYSIEQAKLANAVSGRAGTALRYAVKQIGDSYVWGAAGPIKWDCSGLTMRSFQQAGVRLPHSSRAQFGYGRSISRSNLQPGDLVFFGSPISHVGIYIGKNKMVHAPRPGARVQIAEFGNYFGRKKYVGARRL